MHDLAKAAALVNAVTINYLSLHLLMLTYMAMAFVGAYLLFRNSEVVMWSVVIMEMILWMILAFNVISKIWGYPDFVASSVSAVLKALNP